MDDVFTWFQLMQELGLRFKPCTYLIAHKCDLARHREISLEETLLVARELGIKLYETSTKFPCQMLDRILAEMVEQAVKSDNVCSEPLLLRDPTIKLVPDVAKNTPADSGCFGSPSKKSVQADLLDRLPYLASAESAVLGAMESMSYVQSRRGDQGRVRAERRPVPSQEIYCPLSCGEILSSRAVYIEKHIQNECAKRLVACPLGCGNKIAFDAVRTHVRQNCQNRMEFCSICEDLVQQDLFDSHQTRWGRRPLVLWNQRDVPHFLQGNFGDQVARRYLDLQLNLNGHDLCSMEQQRKLSERMAISLDRLQARLPHAKVDKSSDTEFEKQPTESPSFSSRKNAQAPPPPNADIAERAFSQAVSFLEKSNVDGGQQADTSPPVFLQSINKMENSCQTKAKSDTIQTDQPDSKFNPQSEQTKRQQPPSFLAAVANFDRAKLQQTENNVSPRLRATSSSNPPLNPLMVGIATFRKEKLRRTTPRQQPSSTSPKSSGNSLFDSLAQKIKERRKVIDSSQSRDDGTDESENDFF